MPSLRSVIEALGTSVRVAGEPSALDREVTDVVLVGPGDAPPSAPNAVLLCTDPPALAGPFDAAAVVVRNGEGALPANNRSPVLVADTDLTWDQLLHLLMAATGTPRSAPLVGDLFSLANAVAASVGGATAIEDPHRRVLAYSTLAGQRVDEARKAGILGRQVPDLARNDAKYRDVTRARGVVRVPRDGDILPRLAVAVRAGPEVLGYLWVIECEPMPPEADERLLEAARLTALHLLQVRAGREAERTARGEVLRALLEGRSTPQMAAARLGTQVGAPVTVLAFALPSGVTGLSEIEQEAVTDLVHLHCAALRSRSSILLARDVVYVLLPCDGLPRARIGQLAQSVSQRVHAALGVRLTVGIGAAVAGLAEVRRSRADADAVLQVVAPGGVAALEEVQAQVALLALGRQLADADHLHLPAVLRMLDHDAEHSTRYGESVLAYLAASQDVAAAAASVSVHQNTFRYRLRRARELFDLDLEDPDARLLTWLHLRSLRPERAAPPGQDDRPPSTSDGP